MQTLANLLISEFVHTVSERSLLAMPLVTVANIAIIAQNIEQSFLLLDYDSKAPMILHPQFLDELKVVVQACRDILEIDRIRIDFLPGHMVMVGYRNGKFYQERLGGYGANS